MSKIDKNKIRRILVIRTDRMGDLLLNIPAIRALKQSFNADITVLADAFLEDLLAGIPEIDRVFPFDEKEWGKNIFFRLRILSKIRRGRFDLVVIANPSKRFHLLACLARIRRRLGYDRKWGFLLTHKIKDVKSLGQKHEVEYNLDLVRSIGADTGETGISLISRERDEQFIEEALARQAVGQKDLLIALHPFSANPAKCWPQENFVCLADMLHSRFGARIVLIGGQEEKERGRELASLVRYPLVNLCAELQLEQLPAFFKRCSLLISNDSGPVHIASACGVRNIVIFGRNMPGVGPKRWRPWGKEQIVLHRDPGCNPCLDRNCPYDFKCLRAITPEEVIGSAESILMQNENINC